MLKLRTTPEEGFSITVAGAPIVVAPLSTSALARLRRKHTTVKRGVESVNGPELTKDMFDLTVKSWGPEILDEDGSPLPCSSEVKRKLCEHSAGFVSDVFAEMEEVEKARRTGEEGNSGPGPNGTSSQGE